MCRLRPKTNDQSKQRSKGKRHSHVGVEPPLANGALVLLSFGQEGQHLVPPIYFLNRETCTARHGRAHKDSKMPLKQLPVGRFWKTKKAKKAQKMAE